MRNVDQQRNYSLYRTKFNDGNEQICIVASLFVVDSTLN